MFEADLLVPGSFADAMQGCSVVHHVASPFLMPEKIKNGRTQLLEPALQGVRNVLTTVNATSSVERVVLTSTIGAIFGDYRDVLDMPGQTLSEAFFNTTSSLDHNPYHYSKVVAEQEAWAMSRAQLSPKYIRNHLGIRFGLDNRRSRQELGVDYRPVEQTLHSWERQRRA